MYVECYLDVRSCTPLPPPRARIKQVASVQVYRLLDLVWRIFKDYFTTKMVMLVDCLMESMAELADDIVVRCIIDQTLVGPDLPHPVHLLIISLPQILCNNFDSPHTTRASTCFWKLMRNMLFSQAQPHAQMGSLERIALRSYLRAASDIADEDQFLAANAPDGQQLTISLISLLVKNGVLHRVVDIIWYTAPKNFVRFHPEPLFFVSQPLLVCPPHLNE